MSKSEIKEAFWIDKSVFNEENQVYKEIMEATYGLQVHQYDNAQAGIEAIKKAEYYLPIFIITSGSIYPEFYNFFKNAITYIKNLPVQIIFTSNAKSFLEQHKNDEIGKQIGKFYNLGGVTEDFLQVEDFIKKTSKKLKEYKVDCQYTYERSRDFRGLQTFTYLKENEKLDLPSFYRDVLNHNKIDYKEIKVLIDFMLKNFGNDQICYLLKGMILFDDIPEPILSKFFARAYTLESSFYGIMNQNLMKKNYKIYLTYIKLLYKGIFNNSYKPKTNCTLYRGTRLEKFEIKFLKDMLEKKKSSQKIPMIYSTSFLSFSTDDEVSKGLTSRREASEENRETILKLNPLSAEDEKEIMKTNASLREISLFHEEDEVLFFPFSSFELVDVKEYDKTMTVITLDYSLRFKEKVENCGYFDESGCLII